MGKPKLNANCEHKILLNTEGEKCICDECGGYVCDICGYCFFSPLEEDKYEAI